MAREAGQSTSSLIEATAVRLFSDVGYEGASMRQIAAEVGIQPASLYNHWGSKENILWEIVDKALTYIQNGQVEAFRSHSGTVARFRAFVAMHMRFHAEYSKMARVVNGNLASLSKEHFVIAAERRDWYERGLRSLLEQGVSEGVFSIPNTQITSYAILEMGMGISTWFRPDGKIGLGEVVDLYTSLALRLVGHDNEIRPPGTRNG